MASPLSFQPLLPKQQLAKNLVQQSNLPNNLFQATVEGGMEGLNIKNHPQKERVWNEVKTEALKELQDMLASTISGLVLSSFSNQDVIEILQKGEATPLTQKMEDLLKERDSPINIAILSLIVTSDFAGRHIAKATELFKQEGVQFPFANQKG